MADEPGLGVVDHRCEVFGYEGLFCMDSSAIPTSLGVNPSLTISAVCERAAAALVAAPPTTACRSARRASATAPPGVASCGERRRPWQRRIQNRRPARLSFARPDGRRRPPSKYAGDIAARPGRPGG